MSGSLSISDDNELLFTLHEASGTGVNFNLTLSRDLLGMMVDLTSLNSLYPYSFDITGTALEVHQELGIDYAEVTINDDELTTAAFGEGLLFVKEEGDNYVVQLNGNLIDGTRIDLRYTHKKSDVNPMYGQIVVDGTAYDADVDFTYDYERICYDDSCASGYYDSVFNVTVKGYELGIDNVIGVAPTYQFALKFNLALIGTYVYLNERSASGMYSIECTGDDVSFSQSYKNNVFRAQVGNDAAGSTPAFRSGTLWVEKNAYSDDYGLYLTGELTNGHTVSMRFNLR